MPPHSGRFGLAAFSSSATSPGAPSRRAAHSANSSGLSPQKFATTRAPSRDERRQAIAQERLDADVLQPDGVQHARRALDQPRRRLARVGLERQALDADRPDRGEIDHARRTRAP